jgi:hypothetical protein
MSDKPKSPCFKPTFENGGYWEYYKDLERQFASFLEFVPYLSGNESVYSFRLANQILAIGAHIDSAFKEMFRYSEISKKYPKMLKKISDDKATIADYRKLEKEYSLSKMHVTFKRLPEREVVFPFQQFGQSKSPDWWHIYNGIKHKFSDNFEKANLRNTRDALAGAFLLNVIHTPAYIRLIEYRLVTPQPIGTGSGVFVFKGGETLKQSVDRLIQKGKRLGCIETPLFFFDYRE